MTNTNTNTNADTDRPTDTDSESETIENDPLPWGLPLYKRAEPWHPLIKLFGAGVIGVYLWRLSGEYQVLLAGPGIETLVIELLGLAMVAYLAVMTLLDRTASPPDR